MFTAVVVPHAARPALAIPGFGRLPDAWSVRLRHPDPVVRRGAAWLLGRYPPSPLRPQDDAVARDLGELLVRETDLPTSLAAVATLGTRVYPHSVEMLRTVVTAPRENAARPEVQAAALQALGSLGDELGLHALLQAGATDGAGLSTGEVADAAARALADLPDNVLSEALVQARRTSSQLAVVFRAMGYRGDPRWGTALVEQLRLPARPSTVAAVEAVARLRLTEAAPRLVELVVSTSARPEDMVVRRAALRALGSLGGGFDPMALRSAVDDAGIRDVALDTCGALGDPRLVPVVTPLLAAPWAADRARAADALGALGSASALPALLARAADEEVPSVRRSLWRAVGRLGGPPAATALARASDDPLARWALAEMALRGGRVPVIPGDDAPAQVVRALAGGGADAGGLGSPSADLRVAAAMALGAAATGAAPLAARLERENDEGVRVAIVLALGRAEPGAVAAGALRRLLDREADEPSPAAVVAASVAGRRHVTAAAPALRGMLRARWGVGRSEAARALGVLGDDSAQSALESAVAFDSDPQARGAAAVALGALVGARAEGALRMAASTAWTGSLWEMVARARAAARSGGRPWFAGPAMARLSGAPPRSVWAVALPDGGFVYGVAAGDGEVLIPGVPSADSTLQRLDVANPAQIL